MSFTHPHFVEVCLTKEDTPTRAYFRFPLIFWSF